MGIRTNQTEFSRVQKLCDLISLFFQLKIHSKLKNLPQYQRASFLEPRTKFPSKRFLFRSISAKIA